MYIVLKNITIPATSTNTISNQNKPKIILRSNFHSSQTYTHKYLKIIEILQI